MGFIKGLIFCATQRNSHVCHMFVVRSLGMAAFAFAILNRQIRLHGNYHRDRKCIFSVGNLSSPPPEFAPHCGGRCFSSGSLLNWYPILDEVSRRCYLWWTRDDQRGLVGAGMVQHSSWWRLPALAACRLGLGSRVPAGGPRSALCLFPAFACPFSEIFQQAPRRLPGKS